MLDAGALDPRRELAADLLGELGSDLVAEKGGDVFGFDGQDRLPGKLFIEGFEDGWRAEHRISGVFDLHETPVVGRARALDRVAVRQIGIVEDPDLPRRKKSRHSLGVQAPGSVPVTMIRS